MGNKYKKRRPFGLRSRFFRSGYRSVDVDHLSGVNIVCVRDAVPPLQMTDGHSVIHGNPAQRIATANHVITPVDVGSWPAIIRNRVISAGDI